MRDKSKNREVKRRKNRSKSSFLQRMISLITNFILCRAIRSAKAKFCDQFKKFKNYYLELPVVVVISEKLRLFILAVFGYTAPVWNFLFLHTKKKTVNDTS